MAKCISPINLKDNPISVPCGNCLPCMKNRASNWSFRLIQESKRAETAYFVTLTYDTDTVPITNNGFMSLDKKDYQKFMKRLRKVNTKKLKYYTVGEYGGKFNRPHYHAIMFNLDLSTLIGKPMAKQFERGILPMDGKFPVESQIWGKGHVTIGKVSEASIGYTLIYISKGGEVPKHQRDDRQPEFSLMSKRIGSNYLTTKTKIVVNEYLNKKGNIIRRKTEILDMSDSKMQRWHKDDLVNRYYVNIKTSEGLAKAPMPRYYKDKLYTDWQKQKIGYHLQNQELTEWNKLSYEQKMEEYRKQESKNQRLHYKKINRKI